jgi:hypothetical protein
MPVIDAYKNLAIGSVLTAPSPAASGTTLVLNAGQGAYFPAAPFDVTIWPSSSYPSPTNAEVARCTAKVTDTLTLTRGTPARTVLVGDLVAATFTETFVAAVQDASNHNAGTLADARLSANVPLKNAANTFSNYQMVNVGPNVGIGGYSGTLYLNDPTAPANKRLWAFVFAGSGLLFLAAKSDAGQTTGANLYLDPAGSLVWGGDFYEKGRGVPLGTWIDVPYNLNNFTSDKGNYTTFSFPSATCYAYAYTLIGKTCIFAFNGQGGTIASSPIELRIALPAGVTSAKLLSVNIHANDGAAVSAAGFVQVSGSAYLSVYKDPSGATPWTNGTAFSLQFEISFPIP